MMAVLIVGCSKHPSKPLSHLPANTKDLGVVEFTDGTPQHFSLGDGKGCTVTGKHVSDGIEVIFMIESTNANGTVKLIGTPRLTAPPGQRTAIGIGDVSIEFIPEWKKQSWSSSSTIVFPPDISFSSLHSGMTVQEVIAALGQPSQTNADGLEFSSVGLFICPDTGEVTLIPPSAGRTKEGIGMGSSRADIIRAYGEPSSVKIGARSGVSFEALWYSPSHMSFQLRDGKVDWMDISTK
jgi:hypothetical protein